jgi:Fic family protein
VTSDGNLEGFVKFILKAFTTQANHSLALLQRIQELQHEFKNEIRTGLPSVYSHELLDALFARPVQTPVRLADDIGIHYVTASKYLKKLEKTGLLRSSKRGRHAYFINFKLLELIEQKGHMEPKKPVIAKTELKVN